ncbi:hypothetical protein MCHI_000451 [Candidatus Magnetoovum chiemensis]|nr:hypothetical protein MCHI_000451 [Candidatus Magnetoovum chiemensis]
MPMQQERKTLMCPVVKQEVILKITWFKPEIGQETPKELEDCTGANECGAEVIEKARFVYHWEKCPFSKALHKL